MKAHTPDEDVELLAFHLQVSLLLIELVLQALINVRQLISS